MIFCLCLAVLVFFLSWSFVLNYSLAIFLGLFYGLLYWFFVLVFVLGLLFGSSVNYFGLSLFS